jgi:RND family efflux transporter MFP subunit
MAMNMTVRTTSNLRYGRLGLTAALLLATAGCSRSNVQAAAPAMPAPLVTVVKATAQDVPKYLDEIGRNAAFESVTVTPQVGGRIVERHFQDGENLKKGQLLFVVDPRPYKAQLDSAQASLAQAKAALDLARIQFARDEEVIGERAISKQDYDTKKNAVDVDQALVEAAEAALETARLNFEYCYIHSPIDGRAGARLVDVGNVVQANTNGLIGYRKNREFRIQQEHLLESAQDAARLSEVRFKAGTTDYLEVLTNETNSFSAELGLAQAQGNELISLVQIYQALGGGWQQ